MVIMISYVKENNISTAIEQYFADGFSFVEIIYNGVAYALYHRSKRVYTDNGLEYTQNGVTKLFQYSQIAGISI